MGEVLGIATRLKVKAPMDVCDQADITFDKGVGNDSRGKFKGKRQVTVMSKESWDAVCQELNNNAPWTVRRANILISGIELRGTTGQQLRIGDCLLEITGELVPCERMDAQIPGLTNALTSEWRGGVTCKIIEEGKVSVGDKTSIGVQE